MLHITELTINNNKQNNYCYFDKLQSVLKPATFCFKKETPLQQINKFEQQPKNSLNSISYLEHKRDTLGEKVNV